MKSKLLFIFAIIILSVDFAYAQVSVLPAELRGIVLNMPVAELRKLRKEATSIAELMEKSANQQELLLYDQLKSAELVMYFIEKGKLKAVNIAQPIEDPQDEASWWKLVREKYGQPAKFKFSGDPYYALEAIWPTPSYTITSAFPVKSNQLVATITLVDNDYLKQMGIKTSISEAEARKILNEKKPVLLAAGIDAQNIRLEFDQKPITTGSKAPTLPPMVREVAPLLIESKPPTFLSYSVRPWANMNDEERDLKLFMDTGTESKGLLAYGGLSGIPVWNAKRRLIAFDVAGEVHILDLNQESLTRLSSATRAVTFDPNFDSTGTRLVVASSYTESITVAEEDICLYTNNRGTYWSREADCMLKGIDSLPIFSPDDKYVYFVNKSEMGSKLYRVAVEANKLGKPEKLADLPVDNIDRLSWTNNGQTLAISSENVAESLRSLKFFTFDTRSRKITAKSLAFKTNAYPEISLSNSRQIGFSADGQIVYFNAVVKTPQDKRGTTRNAYFKATDKVLHLLGDDDVKPLNAYEYEKSKVTGIEAFRKLRTTPLSSLSR